MNKLKLTVYLKWIDGNEGMWKKGFDLDDYPNEFQCFSFSCETDLQRLDIEHLKEFKEWLKKIEFFYKRLVL